MAGKEAAEWLAVERAKQEPPPQGQAEKRRKSGVEIIASYQFDANSRLGWYRRCGMNVVNFIISKDLLENRIKDGAGLLNPLSYYLVKVGMFHTQQQAAGWFMSWTAESGRAGF